jgi:hypothetical protein
MVIKGIATVEYLPEEEVFIVTYESGKANIADMFSAIWIAGRNQGREFMPERVD